MDDPKRLVLHHFFGALPDPRVERTKRHQLLDIITIAVCAVIAGADTFVDIEYFGHARRDWFATFLALPNGIPSHDTFGRVFARLNPDAFEACFLGWVQAILPRPDGEIVAIDGKVARRSHDHGAGRPPIELVSAWASDHQLVLGQLAVAATSNEIPAVPALLELLDVRGAVVTLDAHHCQRATAAAIRDGGGEYVLALKRNQPAAHDAVATFCAEAIAAEWRGLPHEHLVTRDDAHGRVEVRRYWTTTDPDLLAYLNPGGQVWPDLRAVGLVERERATAARTSREVHYYLTSLDGRVTTFAASVRGHWGIENRQHWVLDLALREDESRVRSGHAAENLAIVRRIALNLIRVRRIALNLIRLDRDTPGSVHTKRLKAAWDHAFLLHLLSRSPAK